MRIRLHFIIQPKKKGTTNQYLDQLLYTQLAALVLAYPKTHERPKRVHATQTTKRLYVHFLFEKPN
jgi:hypothetical protein